MPVPARVHMRRARDNLQDSILSPSTHPRVPGVELRTSGRCAKCLHPLSKLSGSIYPVYFMNKNVKLSFFFFFQNQNQVSGKVFFSPLPPHLQPVTWIRHGVCQFLLPCSCLTRRIFCAICNTHYYFLLNFKCPRDLGHFQDSLYVNSMFHEFGTMYQCNLISVVCKKGLSGSSQPATASATGTLTISFL